MIYDATNNKSLQKRKTGKNQASTQSAEKIQARMFPNQMEMQPAEIFLYLISRLKNTFFSKQPEDTCHQENIQTRCYPENRREWKCGYLRNISAKKYATARISHSLMKKAALADCSEKKNQPRIPNTARLV